MIRDLKVRLKIIFLEVIKIFKFYRKAQKIQLLFHFLRKKVHLIERWQSIKITFRIKLNMNLVKKEKIY